MNQSSKDVVDYYQNSQWLYKLFSYAGSSLSMHHGFWNEETKRRKEAVENENQAVIKLGNISEDHVVLDAGCGVGGTAISIAQTTGASVTGITIVPDQIRLAKSYAKKAGISKLTKFRLEDYTKTSLPTYSFDVVYGIESISHSKPKINFLKEAYRLLKTNGKLIIADGYLARNPKGKYEKRLVKKFIKNFAMPEFIQIEEMEKQMRLAGFENIKRIDKTEAVKPTVNHFKFISTIMKPISTLAFLFPIKKLKAMRKNQISLECIYEFKKLKLAKYYINTAEKK